MDESIARSDMLVRQLAALASPQRLRILAALTLHGRHYVSELARVVKLSRPLLYLHLEKLESAGLVRGQLMLSDDGKALKWFEVCDFRLDLTPTALAEIAATLTDRKERDA